MHQLVNDLSWSDFFLKRKNSFLPIFSYPEACVNYYIEDAMLLDICCLESRVAGMNFDLITCIHVSWLRVVWIREQPSVSLHYHLWTIYYVYSFLSNTNSLCEPEIKTTNTLPILVCARDGRYPWLKNDPYSASSETCLPHHDVDDDAAENKQCCLFWSSSKRCEVFAKAMCEVWIEIEDNVLYILNRHVGLV